VKIINDGIGTPKCRRCNSSLFEYEKKNSDRALSEAYKKFTLIYTARLSDTISLLLITLLTGQDHHIFLVGLNLWFDDFFLPVCRHDVFNGYGDGFLRAAPDLQKNLVDFFDNFYVCAFQSCMVS
jgi:hypothetical protein